MHILEFHGDVLGEVHPGADTQHCPVLTGNRAPPRQISARKESHGHLHLLSDVCNATYHAVLLRIEEPVG